MYSVGVSSNYIVFTTLIFDTCNSIVMCIYMALFVITYVNIILIHLKNFLHKEYFIMYYFST